MWPIVKPYLAAIYETIVSVDTQVSGMRDAAQGMEKENVAPGPSFGAAQRQP
jgi:hypothetical protein